VLASRRQWVLNEKGSVEQADLVDSAELLLGAGDSRTLEAAIAEVTDCPDLSRPRAVP
jgi:hypothetical protein